jgi:hypothetical protein
MRKRTGTRPQKEGGAKRPRTENLSLDDLQSWVDGVLNEDKTPQLVEYLPKLSKASVVIHSRRYSCNSDMFHRPSQASSALVQKVVLVFHNQHVYLSHLLQQKMTANIINNQDVSLVGDVSVVLVVLSLVRPCEARRGTETMCIQ